MKIDYSNGNAVCTFEIGSALGTFFIKFASANEIMGYYTSTLALTAFKYVFTTPTLS